MKDVGPAYSLVTAPDFFPLIDGADLEIFDRELFLEGGTELLSGGRLRANPNVPLPGSHIAAFPDPEMGLSDPAFTITAVLTDRRKRGRWYGSQTRAYVSTNTLPDTASNVFAPGWDTTYSGRPGGDFTVHLSTIGLGSPFTEDVKLCAAANGMWPGSSPDAARTFQGALKPVHVGALRKRRPPTATPLMDGELGYHPLSPAVVTHGQEPHPGWDGEHGPFVERRNGSLHVNFADICDSDYVRNSLAGQLRFSLLRRLTTAEMLARINALRLCIAKLPGGGQPRRTKLWLVSAERVQDWRAGAAGHGILPTLLGRSNSWATTSRLGVAGAGFLYVFADIGDNESSPTAQSRLLQRCESLYVCQVSEERLAYVRIGSREEAPPTDSAWRVIG